MAAFVDGVLVKLALFKREAQESGLQQDTFTLLLTLDGWTVFLLNIDNKDKAVEV